jgi:hypothetical protein
MKCPNPDNKTGKCNLSACPVFYLSCKELEKTKHRHFGRSGKKWQEYPATGTSKGDYEYHRKIQRETDERILR